MAHAEVLNDGGVHLGSYALRPAGGVEEVAGAEEVDKEGGQLGVRFEARHAGDEEVLLGGTLELSAGEFNLLLNVLALGNLVKVLDANVTTIAGAVLAVVGPELAVNAPATAVPAVLLHALVEGKAADDDNPAAGTAKGGDLWFGPPFTAALVDIAVLEILAKVAIGAPAGALALEAHEDGLAGVLIKEAIYVLEHVTKVLGARQRNGEGAVNEGELVVVGADGEADVEEANAILQLLGNTDGLAPDRRQRLVAGRRVVGAGDGQQRERPLVVELLHPGVELGRGEDGQVGAGGHVHDGEVVGAAVELLHD